jgi:nucleoside 2-deoxyribosyltransferase
MKTAYIIGPVTDAFEAAVAVNISRASEVRDYLMGLNVAVFCPHTNYSGARASHEWIMRACFRHLSSCDFAVVLPGWQRSTGSCQGVGFAIAKNIPVYYWPEDHAAIERAAKGAVHVA